VDDDVTRGPTFAAPSEVGKTKVGSFKPVIEQGDLEHLRRTYVTKLSAGPQKAVRGG